jgi:hypothetical protein
MPKFKEFNNANKVNASNDGGYSERQGIRIDKDQANPEKSESPKQKSLPEKKSIQGYGFLRHQPFAP